MSSRIPVVVSYGGETDSTALLIACKERGVKIDAILFSDGTHTAM